MSSQKYTRFAKRSTMISIISSIIILAFLATSCDEIGAPYTKNASERDTLVLRKILLEDYTGARCGNCPKAHDVIKTLKGLYNDTLIVMAIHATSFATPDPSHPYDFRTAVGATFNTDFGMGSIGYPIGMINRMKYKQNQAIEYADWKTFIADSLLAFYKQTYIKIDLTPTYNLSTREIVANINVHYYKAGKTNQNICVYIVEDSIVAPQSNDDLTPPLIKEYVHNFVLRDAMAGTYGEQLSTVDFPRGTSFVKQYKYTIPATKDWRPDKLRVVAFVEDFNAEKVILQAEEKALTIQ